MGYLSCSNFDLRRAVCLSVRLLSCYAFAVAAAFASAVLLRRN